MSASSADALMQPGKPGDDPRVAEGPLRRPLPDRPLGAAAWSGVLLALLGLLAWEMHWRGFGVTPGARNSDGQWADQRERIDRGEGRTVLLGASRVLFDFDLDTWERVTGERPIQLAMEGTTPVPMLEDLAGDEDFRGRVLVGVAPDVYFSGFEYRGEVLRYYRGRTPSQRASDWLSTHLLETRLAYYSDPDFALFTVLKRQAWPKRAGVPSYIDVRKLSVSAPDRNTAMWEKVVQDPAYRALCRQVWAQFFDVPIPGMDTPEALKAAADKQIARTVAAVEKLRARGVPVLFVRPPSDGEYLAYERRDFPRAGTWDALLARTGSPGVHFEDHAELQGLELPEWSHLSASDARVYTERVLAIVEREALWKRAAEASAPR